MKINPVISKIESFNIQVNSKKKFHNEVRKGDLVSVIYYDLEKEQIRLQQFIGTCVKLKSKGFNTKLCLSNSFKKVLIEQQFFLYSNSILDVAVLKKSKK